MSAAIQIDPMATLQSSISDEGLHAAEHAFGEAVPAAVGDPVFPAISEFA
jgi:hypothetical protein